MDLDNFGSRIAARRLRLRLRLEDFFPRRGRMLTIEREGRVRSATLAHVADVLGVCPGALLDGCPYSAICSHCGAESAPGAHACGAE